MKQREVNIRELSEFLLDYIISLLMAGANTERAVRGTLRIANSFGYEVTIAILQTNIMMTIYDPDSDYTRTFVRHQNVPKINFNLVSELSSLSWYVLDNHMSLEEAKKRYNEILVSKTISWPVMWISVSIVNIFWCKLFNGDIGSMIIVFVATVLSVLVREICIRFKLDARLTYVLVSFTASFIALMLSQTGISETVDVALYTSVLFLTPGVLIINSVTDILDGHILTGFARGIYAFIILICIALGLYSTIMIQQVCDL